MEQTWPWHGPDDPVMLADVRQAGTTDIVTALHQIPVGAIWPLKAILHAGYEENILRPALFAVSILSGHTAHGRDDRGPHFRNGLRPVFFSFKNQAFSITTFNP